MSDNLNWKIGEFWSSSTPHTKVLCLMKDGHEKHHSFIQMIADSETLQHQQSRIDTLEAQLAIAVDALEFYDKCDHFINKPDGKVELVDHGCKATEALTRIKQLQEKS